MHMPFFSIIVPIYRVKKEYLDACVESILNQSAGDFELILVDDGSPDACGDYCDEYAARDARVRVIHQENQGVSAARNNGIEAAQGEWILFVDGDDWIEPDTCERLQAKLQKADCDILHFGMVREAADRSEKMSCGLRFDRPYDMKCTQDREEIYLCAVQTPNALGKRRNPSYYSWDKAYRRSFLQENDLRYPVGMKKSEDKVFILRCLQCVEKYTVIEDAFYHYRMNEESICHSYSASIDEDRIHLLEVLDPIVREMNDELAHRMGEADYHRILDAHERFIFGLISDVLFLKFYHADNPDRAGRRREALRFLKREPFAAVLRRLPYSKLGRNAKLKKVLLRMGLVSTFCHLSQSRQMCR